MTTQLTTEIKAAWNAVPSGILFITTDSRVLFANAAAGQLLGLEPSDLGAPVQLAHIIGRDNASSIASQLQRYASPLRVDLNDPNVSVFCAYSDEFAGWVMHVTATEQKPSISKTMVNQSESSVLFLDEDFNITWGNERFFAISGLKSDDITGMPAFNWINQTAEHCDEDKAKASIKKTGLFRLQVCHQHPIFGEYWVAASIKKQPQNDTASYFLIETDITDQVLLKQQLQQAYQLQQTILDNANLLLITTDSDGVIQSCNKFAEQQLHTSAKDLIGKASPDQFFNHATRQAVLAHLALPAPTNERKLTQLINRAALRNPIHDAEWPWESSNGDILSISCSIAPITLSHSDQPHYLYVGKDMSALRKAEATSNRQNEILKATGFMAKIGGWEYDFQYDQLTWSDSIFDIHELPYDHRIDIKDAVNYYTGESKTEISDAINLALETGKPWDLQCTFRTAKGKDIWVRAVGEIEYENGQPIRIRGTLQDISQLKLAEEKALENSRAKSAFLANMSHEIRTPINGIMGMHELIAAAGLNEKQQQYLDLAKESGNVLLELINDILDVSKIEAGKLDIENIVFDLHALLISVTKVNRLKANEKGLSLTLDVAPMTPNYMKGDPVRLRQILTNLLSNAVKFTEKGEVSLTVACKRNKVTFDITDTGIGIPKQKLSQLFKPFEQLDTSTTRRFGGTGLGLAISHQLTSLMQGSITATSVSGKGSTFSVTLPLVSQEAQQETLPSDTPSPILLVANSEALHAYWQRLALHSACSLTHVSDAKSAMAWLKTASLPVTIVVQRELEGMNGAEFCKLLSHHPKYQHCLIIGTASKWKIGLASEFDNAGANGYFTPTLSMNTLSERLNQAKFNSLPDLFHTDLGSVERQQNEIERFQGDRRGHVLLVEDNKINQLVAAELLKNLGYSHDIANNGQEAIEMLTKPASKYQLVLMDCQMPVMDGYQASKIIRQSPELAAYQHIPIIALTANAMNGDRQKCEAHGMNGYLSKPVTLSAMAKELTRIENLT